MRQRSFKDIPDTVSDRGRDCVLGYLNCLGTRRCLARQSVAKDVGGTYLTRLRPLRIVEQRLSSLPVGRGEVAENHLAPAFQMGTAEAGETADPFHLQSI